MTDGERALHQLYEKLRRKTAVSDFLNLREGILASLNRDEIHLVRLGRGIFKKYVDEVIPVSRFTKQCAKPTDLIQFPFDNEIPDCHLWHDGTRHRRIEITVSQGKERRYVMEKLNTDGTAPGFFGLTDAHSNEEFVSALQRPRAHSIEETKAACVHALTLRLRAKKNVTGADTLLIETSPLYLPKDRWSEILPDVRTAAHRTTFSDVFIVGYARDGGDFCMPLKGELPH